MKHSSLNSIWGKIFPNKEKRALKRLEITEVSLDLAKQLRNQAERLKFSLKTLGLTENSWKQALAIKSKGLVPFCLEALNIQMSDLVETIRLSSMKKVDKIQELVKNDSSIRGFFNKAYVYYEKYKKKNKASWKKETSKKHLSRLKIAIEKCIVEDKITEEAACEMAMLVHMAFYQDKHNIS